MPNSRKVSSLPTPVEARLFHTASSFFGEISAGEVVLALRDSTADWMRDERDKHARRDRAHLMLSLMSFLADLERMTLAAAAHAPAHHAHPELPMCGAAAAQA